MAPIRELPYGPAAHIAAPRGRTDGSIRLRAKSSRFTACVFWGVHRWEADVEDFRSRLFLAPLCPISKWPTDCLPYFLSAPTVRAGGGKQRRSCDEGCRQSGKDNPIPNVGAVARPPGRLYEETPILKMALSLPFKGWFRWTTKP